MPPLQRRPVHAGYDAMDPLASTTFAQPARLTKLYTDTKRSSVIAAPPTTVNDDPLILSLNRKLRIQKDRLIAWGLEWTDEVGNAQGDIDKSVERAGLTEVVSSIMENIKGILEEVERMNRSGTSNTSSISKGSLPNPPSASNPWTATEKNHYDDLIRDLTSANDLLCELSKSRRSEHPLESAKRDQADVVDKKSVEASAGEARKQFTLPAVARPQSPYTPTLDLPTDSGSVPKLDPSMLVLPEEVPPPYQAAGSLQWSLGGQGFSPRSFAHLRRSFYPHGPGNPSPDDPLIPVMIEYVSFDKIYKNSNIPLPMDRLEQLFFLLRRLHHDSTQALSKMIAYFEDPDQARYGLVFEIPPSWHETDSDTQRHVLSAEPVSLFALLRNASRTQSSSSVTTASFVPPLEDRFRLALEAISAFAALHECSYTHRNVSSSSIVLPAKSTLISQGTSEFQYDIRKPIICCFDLFSEYDVDSSPEFLHQNIYRHPDDPRVMGPTASQDYDLRFDLYSLGLVLLEIGMWHPIADLFKEKYSLKDFKTRVEKIWIKRLASRCGTAYMRCVQDCFNAGSQLSPGSSTGEALLAAVYLRVMGRLERCCAIEQDEDDLEVLEAPISQSTATPAQPTVTTPQPALDEKTSRRSMSNGALVAEPETLTPQESFEKSNECKKRSTRYQFPNLELPAEVLWQWNNAIEDRLARIVQKTLGTSKESCAIYLCYTGENEQLAKPTICVGCNSVKKVRAAIRRHLKFNPDVFDLAVVRGSITRSKSSTSRPRRSQGNSASLTVRNPHHHQRPLCGASIGAWRDSEHSPAVSFGGVVMIDDDLYGMSVHHLLEEPDWEDDAGNDNATSAQTPLRSMDRSVSQPSGPVSQGSMIELIEDDSDDDMDASTEADDEDEEDAGDLSDLDLDDYGEDDTFEIDIAATTAGDREGVSGGDGEEIIITQPALPDVAKDFFPCEEDKDEDHIDSHALGHVHASSGLRRLIHNGVEHEIDWLLMKLKEERLQPYNLVAGGKRYCHQDSLFGFRPTLIDPICRQHYPAQEDLYPRRIAPSDQLSGLQVHCVGRTSGLGHGRISQTMHLVRFQGRRTFSRAWSVAGTFGCGGDSGAWVVDNEQGRICGHVLAWSNNLAMAYISPMDIMFEDMAQQLGVSKVCLPGVEEDVKPISVAHSTDPMSEIENLTLEDIRQHKYLLAKHSLMTGNPTRLEREWSQRRSTLGQMASG